MPSIRFLDGTRSAPPQQLRRLADELGLPLPMRYVGFLAEQGGGRPEPNVSVRPEARPLGVGVTSFFGLDRPSEADLLDRWHAYRARVPERFLPIADAEGGNLILLALSGSDTGAVFFWDHEWEADDGAEPSEHNLTFLAPDFATFLDSLQPPASTGPEPTAVREAWIDPAFLSALDEDR